MGRNVRVQSLSRLFISLITLFLFFQGSPGQAEAVVYVHNSPVVLTWDPAPGTVDHYNVYVSLNQGPYSLYGTAPTNTVNLPVQDGARYVVQVEAEDPLGRTGPLSDPSEEIVVFLQGSASDTDGDGMPDAWEISHGFNPYSPSDGTLDGDGDGLDNAGEYMAGTDPATPDTDGDGVSDGAEITLGQNPLNPVDNVPVANAGPDRVVNPTVVTLNGSASSDPNGDPLAFSWSQLQGPVQVELSDPTAARPSFVVTKWGKYRFRLVVSDGKATSAPDEVTITVRNVAPTADAGPDQVVDAGTQVALDGRASSDANGDSLTFSWSQVEGPAVALAGADSAQASFVPVSAGVYRFRLVVSDGINTSAPDDVRIVVNAVNRVPTADAGEDQTVEAGSTVVLDGSGSADPDGDALEYTWTQIEGPETVVLEGGNSVLASFTAGLAGSYRFQLVVSDGKVASAPDTVTVTVVRVNRPPVALVVASPESVEVGSRVTLDGSASYDPDGDFLTYEWIQTGGPQVALEGAETAAAVFYAVNEGVLTFRLVVRDSEFASASAEVTVTVNGVNHVPVANAGEDLQGSLGSEICLDGSGSYDPDPGDTLTYQWSQKQDGGGTLVTLRGADTPAPCFTPANPGRYVFTLAVSDGKAVSVPDEVAVTVVWRGPYGNRRPVAVVQPYAVALPGSKVVLDGSQSYDPDGDPLQYFWLQRRGEPLKGAAKRQCVLEFVPQSQGLYVFNFMVSDGKIWSEPKQVAVWVTDTLPPGCSVMPQAPSGGGGQLADRLLFVATLFLPAGLTVLYQRRRRRRGSGPAFYG